MHSHAEVIRLPKLQFSQRKGSPALPALLLGRINQAREKKTPLFSSKQANF